MSVSLLRLGALATPRGFFFFGKHCMLLCGVGKWPTPTQTAMQVIECFSLHCCTLKHSVEQDWNSRWNYCKRICRVIAGLGNSLRVLYAMLTQ